MIRLPRSLSTLLAIAVVLVAILGYLSGANAEGLFEPGHAGPAPAAQLRPLSAASVLLESPMSWRSAGAARVIPDLAVSDPVVFAPGGDASQAGLLTGSLSGAEPSPLPARFVAHLERPPITQVVNLTQAEAYRYGGLHLTGFDRLLTVYAMPRAGGDPTLLACYAPPTQAALLRTCERIVATLRPVGQNYSEVLTPEPVYAARLGTAIGALDRERLALRRRMRGGAPLATIGRLAPGLADGFQRAAVYIAQLEPPFAAGRAQAALSAAFIKAHGAYATLAAAAAAEDIAGYESARAQVDAAEAEVDASLETYSLLGYGSQ